MHFMGGKIRYCTSDTRGLYAIQGLHYLESRKIKLEKRVLVNKYYVFSVMKKWLPPVF
jgi:hypothetical protein